LSAVVRPPSVRDAALAALARPRTAFSTSVSPAATEGSAVGALINILDFAGGRRGVPAAGKVPVSRVAPSRVRPPRRCPVHSGPRPPLRPPTRGPRVPVTPPRRGDLALDGVDVTAAARPRRLSTGLAGHGSTHAACPFVV